MSGSTNRYSRISQNRPPKEGRAKRIPGSLEDSGKWFHCRICGFPCNIERNALGEGKGLTSTAFVTGTIQSLGNPAVLLDFRDLITIGEGDETLYTPVSIGGCSLCGSLNWM